MAQTLKPLQWESNRPWRSDSRGIRDVARQWEDNRSLQPSAVDKIFGTVFVPSFNIRHEFLFHRHYFYHFEIGICQNCDLIENKVIRNT